jgi:hypothetical protein
MKPNAVRIPEPAEIEYELREYEVDPNNPAAVSGDRKTELLPLKQVQPLTV